MNIKYYVKRILKFRDGKFSCAKVIHGADDDATLCGYELNDKWFIIGSSKTLHSSIVITCTKCRDKINASI